MKKSNLRKEDICKEINFKMGFSILLSKKIIEDLISILLKNIKENKLIIKNIGSFKLIQKKSRIGRNPKTNEIFDITSRKSVSFYASKKLLKIINE